MPYDIGSGNNLLPGIISVMAAIKQGKLARQQRDQDTQYRQAQIQNMQATEKRTGDQDHINNVLNGIDPQTGQPIPIPHEMMPGQNDDAQTTSLKLLRVATYLDSKGARNLANQYRQTALTQAQQANTYAAVPLRQAQTGLTKAKTTTEQQRPALINAQTQYTKAGVPLRNAQTQRITTIQPQQFQEQQSNQMQRAQAALAAAQTRAAEAQAAAMERLGQRLQFDQQQQQRSFTHSDKARAAASSAKQKPINQEVQQMLPDIQSTLKAHPEATDSQLRAALRKEGYSSQAITLGLMQARTKPKSFVSPAFIKSASNPNQ